MDSKTHKSGFVTIIGKPNAGKSTLMNALVGEKLSIVTPKAQTTRHRIFGILNADDFQIVFSDTPGIITPHYEMQKSMMKFVSYSLEDADAIICLTDPMDEKIEPEMVERIKKSRIPVVFVTNKIDEATSAQLEAIRQWYATFDFPYHTIEISALKSKNTIELLGMILQFMPIHPPYYDKEDLTDRPERFFASEIIREKILLNYRQEIPYSCEVIISGFKDKPEMNVVMAEIIVERDSQKGIIIGPKGAMLKKVGTEARIAMEEFFGKKVFLETHVRVIKDWRSNINQLKKFGYEN